MPSSLLVSTHMRTTSNIACHHVPWTTYTVRRHQVWHSIVSLGLHTRSGNVERGMPKYPLDNTHGQTILGTTYSIALGQDTRSDKVGHCIISYPMDDTHSLKKSGMTCIHGPWTVHTDGRCQAWHAIMVLRLITRSDDVGRGMPSLILGTTHDRTMLGMAFHHSPWTTHMIGRR